MSDLNAYDRYKDALRKEKTRKQSRHSQEVLDAFDELDSEHKIVIFDDLKRYYFVLFYGEERIPGSRDDPNDRIGVRDGVSAEPKPAMKYPDGNPKTQFGIAKPGTWAIDPIAIYVMGMAMLQGQLKYGLFNYFDDPISASTYAEAAQRHLDLYRLGQDLASDTDVEHLGHLMACASILISAHYHGKLLDDRTKNIQMAEDLDKFFQEKQPLIKAIREKWTGFAEAQLAKKAPTLSTGKPSNIGKRGHKNGRWGTITQEFFGFENDRRPYYAILFDGADERSIPVVEFTIDHGH